jgi:hypothetical protein
MSGSMRRDDVNGARCRSDGVWMALARDYVKKQLDNRTATVNDLVSVIIMKEDADAPLILEPIDWVLYNRLVDMREWSELRPSGPGNYMPALEAAERLLSFNPNSSCSLSLMFFSDGRPSDKGKFSKRMGKIAAKYGRRLTVCCIGMADDKTEDFSTLQDMVTEANAYGAISSFNKPSMHADSLSNIITSMVTTLTGSKTEMTNVKTGGQKTVRTDVRRERRGAPDDEVLTSQWTAYRNSDDQHFVRRVWSWSYKTNDFLYLRDPRCIFCFKTVVPYSSEAPGIECYSCRACNVCHECYCAGLFSEHYKHEECYHGLKDVHTGRLVDREITSFAVAMKNPIFDEGAERMVHKFRFLDDNDRFIGQKMVAKQSRFVEMEGSYADRMNYHREFLRTQALASQFADCFNAEIDALVEHFDPDHHGWIRKMPRIHFLEPLVVEVIQDDGKELNILIETQLEGKYEKFNNNMGYVKGRRKVKNDVSSFMNQLELEFGDGADGIRAGLVAIEGGSEEQEESNDEGIVLDTQVSGPDQGENGDVHRKHFPQAFSHFTYEKSKKELMVVDLQGVFQEHKDGSTEYVLTDPVIHKRKHGHNKRSKQLETWTFGRSDHGEKGMKAFFETHGLGTIEEGSEEEEERNDEGIVFDTQVSGAGQGEYGDVHRKNFPQAFSHFTYEKSKKELAVVDLQGVFQEHKDGSTEYVLTDPVIHKRKYGNNKRSKQLEFGRTDRGEKGMKAFFETRGLGAEGSEEEKESNDEGIVFDTQVSGPDQGEYGDVHRKHFPQAFSHFTYEKSKKELMVVDLQGVFQENKDGSTEYVLTDPVIHKRKHGHNKRSKQLETWTFGRTDRGEKGMKAFFETHECTEVCRLLGLKGGPKSRNLSR